MKSAEYVEFWLPVPLECVTSERKSHDHALELLFLFRKHKAKLLTVEGNNAEKRGFDQVIERNSGPTRRSPILNNGQGPGGRQSRI